jgi:hypothetical protein
LFALVVGLSLFVGCKKDDNPVTPPPTGSAAVSLVGTIAGATAGGAVQSGRLTIAIPAAKTSAIASDTVNVTGKIYLSTGDTITLSGIYVKSTGYLNVSGGGFTLTGTLTTGHLVGTYTAPGGYSGNVAASSSGSTNPVTVYCGQYQELTPGTETGTFNLVLQRPALTIVTSNGNTFYGSIADSTVTIYVSGTSGTVLATGTLNATHGQGFYDTPDGKHGQWSADPCQ